MAQKGSAHLAEVEFRLQRNSVALFVNGEEHKLPARGYELDPELTVLEYLREAGLTGTKLACGEGGCGACSVLLSRKDLTGKLTHVSVNACLATVCEMDGAHITTVEGLANRDSTTLHPIQKAISDSHGSQCGYCTPGIVMSMYGLWMKKKEPTVRDIEENFDGNLCRCTGYRPILQAFQPFAQDYKALRAKKAVLPDDGLLEGSAEGKAPKRCCGRKVPAGVGESSINWGEELERRYDAAFAALSPSRGFLVKGTHLGYDCDWCQPVDLRDALVLMSSRSTVRLQVGNTERRIEKFFKGNHTYPLTLISISQVRELQCLEWSNSEVRIGGSMSLENISHAFEEWIAARPKDPRTRVLGAYIRVLRWFAGHQIRNVACMAGNIATASPISDLNPCHVAAGASLEIASLDADGKVQKRIVPMSDAAAPFFSGYRKTALTPQDLIVSVILPLTEADGTEYFEAYKQARRRDDDLAIANAGMRVCFEGENVKDAGFAFGGMAPFTKNCGGLALFWRGKPWTHANFLKSLDVLGTDLPLPDGAPGGMVEFRRTVARSHYFKFWAFVAYERGGRAEPPAPLTERDMSSVLVHSTSAEYLHTPVKGLQHFARDQKSLLQAVGMPSKHCAADIHVTGHAKYTDDVEASKSELFLDFVLSTKAHAKIIRIDGSLARKVDGFVDLVTAADVKGSNATGPIAHDEELLATKEVHCVGQVIAVVCANSRYSARVAAKAVEVEYEQLPAIVSLEQAVQEGSFFDLLFQNPGEKEAQIHTVDLAAGLGDTMDAVIESTKKHAEKYLTIDGEIFMGGQEHFYLETNATRVEPRENDEFHITSSTQNPAETQLLSSKALGVPLSKISSQVKRLGGGFGGKESRPCVLSATACVAAQKLRRPVRFHLDRDVDQQVSGLRHSALGKYKFAVERATGKFVAADIQVYVNGGWSLDLSQPVLNRAMLHVENACRIPSVRVRGSICKTNTPSNTAFRGFGCPQGMLIAETMYEHAARALGRDRELLLASNFYKLGDKTFFSHGLGDSVPIERMWAQLMEQSDFVSRRVAVAEFNRQNRYKKRGLAAVPTKYGISFTATHLNQGGALVHIQKDGTVLVSHGGVEMGQGLHTKLCRVAASVLDVPLEAIYIKETNTDLVANTVATAASSGTDINGGAVMNACEELKLRLAPFVEKNKAPSGASDKERTEALAKAANAAWFSRVNLTAQGYHRTPITGCDWKQQGVNEFNGDPFWYYTWGVGCSEVELDCLTGDLAVLRADLVHDVGRTLNAAIDIGQVEGAFTQGLGLYTVEEVVFANNGSLFSKGPGLYKLPGFGDIPRDFRVHLLEDSEGPPVMGSKAVGEPPLFLGSSAFFAAKDALYAARGDSMVSFSVAPATQGAEATASGFAPAARTPDFFRLDSPATAERLRMSCLDFLNPTGKMTPWHARA